MYASQFKNHQHVVAQTSIGPFVSSLDLSIMHRWSIESANYSTHNSFIRCCLSSVPVHSGIQQRKWPVRVQPDGVREEYRTKMETLAVDPVVLHK